MIDETLKAFTESAALPDRATNVDELPWVPQGERVFVEQVEGLKLWVRRPAASLEVPRGKKEGR